MPPRNSFVSAQTILELLDALIGGRDWTIRDVQVHADVEYNQARAYLKLLEDRYDLDTYRDGRTKVWSWPHTHTMIIQHPNWRPNP